MPRYFFDFRDGPNRSVDEEGLDFESASDAHREATATLGELARDALRERPDGFAGTVAVRDGEGRLSLEAEMVFRIRTERAELGESRLEMVERHVRQAETLVARQQLVVDALPAADPRWRLASELLEQFEGALSAYRQHQTRASGRG